MLFYQKPSENGPTESAEAMMNPLEEALHAGPELRVCVVRDVAAARRPHCSVGDACSARMVKIFKFKYLVLK